MDHVDQQYIDARKEILNLKNETINDVKKNNKHAKIAIAVFAVISYLLGPIDGSIAFALVTIAFLNGLIMDSYLNLYNNMENHVLDYTENDADYRFNALKEDINELKGLIENNV